MGYYPVYLDMQGKRCVVIGTNHEAERKVQQLVDAGAQVTVITEDPPALVEELAEKGALHLERRAYRPGDLAGAFLAIALTTDDIPLSERIAAEGKRENVLMNVADVTHLCTWIAPAIVRRGSLIAAISTSGLSPAMARFAKGEVEKALPEEYEMLLNVIAGVRGQLRREGVRPDPEAWQQALDAETFAALAADDPAAVQAHLLRKLRASVRKERAS